MSEASGTAPQMASFEQIVRVTEADLDDQQHVNNVIYVRWVQDVAVEHWRSRTSAAVQAEVGWVLLRHEIDYRAPALLGDEIRLRTEVPPQEGLKVARFVEIRRVADGRLLASSKTLWVPVDPRTMRPKRVSPELRAHFFAAEE